jgi:hypothetical protein
MGQLLSAFLAGDVEGAGTGSITIIDAFAAGVMASEFPIQVNFAIVGEYEFTADQVLSRHVFDAEVISLSLAVEGERVGIGIGTEPHEFPAGVLNQPNDDPNGGAFPVVVKVLLGAPQAGIYGIALTLDGVRIATLNYEVVASPEIPDDLSGLL